MSARSFSRGWPLVCVEGQWVYEDNGQPINENRPCCRCGQPPTADGHDDCVGHIPGVTSACCGHGVEAEYSVNERNQ